MPSTRGTPARSGLQRPAPARSARAARAAAASGRTGRLLLVGAVLAGAGAAPAAAQASGGVGAAGSEVSQMVIGARAGGVAGALSAGWGDPDLVFYNPAGLVGLERAAGLSFQRHVEDITIGSLSGTTRVGPVFVGGGLAFVNYGSIERLEPDPDFGGERGRPTGEMAGASETTVRLAGAMPAVDGRLLFGLGIGLASSTLDDVSRSAALLDAGLQVAILDGLRVGASVRNLGGAMSGSGGEDVTLPLEARIGTAYRWRSAAGIGVEVLGDVISRVQEGTLAYGAGVEAGFLPDDPEGIGVVGRLGGRLDPDGNDLGVLSVGAGVRWGALGLDYAFRSLDYFGAAHRIGVSWIPGRP